MENNFINERARDLRRLNEEKDKSTALSHKNIEIKRNFLIATTSVSATIIAGLLIFMTISGYNNFKLFAIIGVAIFAFQILISHLYLTTILSFESVQIDKEYSLQKETIENYKKMISQNIVDAQKYSLIIGKVKEKRNKFISIFLRFFSHEIWFIIPNALFIFAFLFLFFITLWFILSNY